MKLCTLLFVAVHLAAGYCSPVQSTIPRETLVDSGIPVSSYTVAEATPIPPTFSNKDIMRQVDPNPREGLEKRAIDWSQIALSSPCVRTAKNLILSIR